MLTSLPGRNNLFLLVILWLAVCFLSVWYHADKTRTNVITWDNYGYYLYLPACLKYQDFDNYDFVKNHHEQYRFSSDIYQIHKSPSGKWTPGYLYGMSILYLPFYLAGDCIARLTQFPADGLSPPYQWSIIIGVLIYGWLAVAILYRLLSVIFDKRSSLVALLVFLLASNYAYYVIAHPASPHALLFFTYSALLWLSYQYFEKPSVVTAALIGLMVGILTLSRPSEVIAALIPVLYGWSKGTPPWKIWKHFSLAGFIVLLLAIPQMLVWHHSTGNWIYNPYPFNPDWLHPHIMDGLLSYRKGFFVYTPVMLLSVIGLAVSKFFSSKWFFPVLIFSILNIYIIFCWPMWWYSSSFGMRALVQSYPVMLIPFCALCVVVSNQGPLLKAIFFILMALLALLNVFQTWQYEKRIIPLDGTTKKYYWKAFGRTEADKMLYQFLDNRDEMPHDVNMTCRTLKEYHPATDENILMRDGKTGAVCDKKKEFSSGISYGLNTDSVFNKEFWLAAEGEYLQLSGNCGEYDQAQLVLSIENENKTYFWRGIRLQHLTDTGKWQKFRFDYRVNLTPDAIINVYIWNTGPDTLLLHSLKLSACDLLEKNQDTIRFE